jgi:hypothetical protein
VLSILTVSRPAGSRSNIGIEFRAPEKCSEVQSLMRHFSIKWESYCMSA